ncbi:cobalt-precorrin-5B (C(1))-methyltransferase CbiD [Calderihabitans maritimus]|uniref:cobalt-precorrin-5B (C(1))-methyltransferase CbiD n=1 Tax=Calderihabitans maritimus TaxID=1246530 RepID=UPI000B50C560|nr:cobalt-precorrin-5B (C(1))-methyltransferase CbiD [Calderihabitans maritimus]
MRSKKREKTRKGYSTGSCAAAAAKAAVMMLFGQEKVERVSIDTPAGIRLDLPVEDVEFTPRWSRCCVVKDAGDDPDITNGLRIYATAEPAAEGVKLKRGRGIGIVKKPGLPVPVGEPAINPVPRAMIEKEITSVLPPGRGVEVTISAPGGEVIARRTLNPRLGIEGGISILGTSGLVEPMSEEAFKYSLVGQIRVAVALGLRRLLLTPGRRGQQLAIERYGVKADAVVQMSNFVGFMLEQCVKEGVKEIVLFGHVGKIGKVAAGIFHTHNRVADGRKETIAAYAALEGATPEVIKNILQANTTETIIDILNHYNLERVFSHLAEEASRRARQYIWGELEVGTVLVDREGEILGYDEQAVTIGRRTGWFRKYWS